MAIENQQDDAQKQQENVQMTTQQLLQSLGDSGTQRYSGYFLEEYNTEWRDENRVDVVEDMRRGDSTVKGVLNAVKAPMLATKWRVDIASDDPKDEEIRAFVEKSLFGMRRSWKAFLREALSYLDFGFYTFELIWAKVPGMGKITIVDLAPRIPRSIQRWQIKGGAFGITQQILTDEFKGNTAEIPAEKLLILTNDKEGDDVTGQSVLRSAYKHWKMKSTQYLIQGVAAERYGVGIPVITPPPAFSDADKAKAEEMGRNLRSNESSYVVLPSSDWKVEILTPNGNPQGAAIDTSIAHHNKQILMAVLATFLGLGTDSSTGSFALSRDQSSFFLKHVEDKASYLAEQINQQVIKKIVDLNFGEREFYPELKFAPMGDIDYSTFSTALKTLADGGMLKVDWKLIDFVHQTFNLPGLTEEDIEGIEEEDVTKAVKDVTKAEEGEDTNMEKKMGKDMKKEMDGEVE